MNPLTSSEAGEGRLQMRRILAAIAALSALVLGGGAGIAGL